MKSNEGDAKARFHALFVGASRPLLAYALRRVTEPADAADVVAETFVVAWRRIDEVPVGGEARLWLFGVARRVLGNHRRPMATNTSVSGGKPLTIRESYAGTLGCASRYPVSLTASLIA